MSDYERELKKTIECYLKNDKSKRATAKELGVSRSTVTRRLDSAANDENLRDLVTVEDIDTQLLQSQVKDLKKEIGKLTKQKISEYEFKKFFYKLKETDYSVPDWVSTNKFSEKTIGVPSISLSDLHWGEVIDKNQVMCCNEYNLNLAKDRLTNFSDSIHDLFLNRIANPEYPGIVVNMLGDLIAGNIHFDLAITNEAEVLEVVQDLYVNLIHFFKKLMDTFGKVFVVAVHGNHGRLSIKPRSKNSAKDNLDWHVACLLQSFFELNGEDRIKFLISDGEDIDYKVYNTTYRATHGTNLGGGGNGILGALAPIYRGDSMKRVQARDMDREYDVLLCGHFHTSLILPRVIANGSLCGMGEFAFKNKFPFEKPRQTAWITHPDLGVTFPMAVQVDDFIKREKTEWVSWRD